MTGIVSCRLSIINIMLERILIRECRVGIAVISDIVRKVRNTRKLLMNFSRSVCLDLGHRPIDVKAYRFNFTAHSKSIYFKNFIK